MSAPNSALTSSASSAASGEIVYGTSAANPEGGGDQHQMSEKVQQMAAAIYKEFERMIQRYDEACVKVRESSAFDVTCANADIFHMHVCDGVKSAVI